jgi:hypothetical protein
VKLDEVTIGVSIPQIAIGLLLLLAIAVILRQMELFHVALILAVVAAAYYVERNAR